MKTSFTKTIKLASLKLLKRRIDNKDVGPSYTGTATLPDDYSQMFLCTFLKWFPIETLLTDIQAFNG